MSSGQTPGLLRRLASMLYECLLLGAVAFAAGSVFLFASGGQVAQTALQRSAQGAVLILFFALYFLWCWLRGGQTLPMKAWKIRLVGASPRRALLRFALALVLVPTGASLVWSLFDRDRQFLHDRLAGTRLILV